MAVLEWLSATGQTLGLAWHKHLDVLMQFRNDSSLDLFRDTRSEKRHRGLIVITRY